jgi:HK97 family phage prohead protease
MLREEENGLYGELKISKTRAGDEALELIKDGALDQLSIGFQPLKDTRRKDGVVERLKAHLAEVSLVTFGAYGDLAAVSAVRDIEETPNMAAARHILEALKK